MRAVCFLFLTAGLALAFQAPAPKRAPPAKIAPAPAKPAAIYKYEPQSDLPEGTAENVDVEESKDGLVVTPRPGGRDVHLQYGFPLGSRNLHIKVNPAIGYTTVADLEFQSACTVHLRQDGAVEVNRPGVKARDVEKVWYVSRSVAIQGKPAIVMVEDESAPKPPDDRITVTGTLVDAKGAPAAGAIACVVIASERGLSIPINLYGGKLNPASARTDAKGRFTIRMDPFPALNLALCEQDPQDMPKYRKTLKAATVPDGQKTFDFGKTAID